MSSSVNAGVLGRGNTLYDSNYSWIVGGDGKTYNSTPNTTFIPNNYIVADSGNVKTSTGSAAAAPRYLQLPGVVAAPNGANDEFTFPIPNGGVSFDSAVEDAYVKKTAGWSKVILDTNTATLTNKSLSNSTTDFVDNVDPTKRIVFQTSSGGTGCTLTLSSTVLTNRTITFPNINGAVLTNNSIATVTNKTFQDSLTWFSDDGTPSKMFQFQCSGLTAGATRTYTAPDADGTLVLVGPAATLTNKSLVNSSTYFVDSIDSTKRIVFDTSGATTGHTLTLASGINGANRTLTFPNISDTITTMNSAHALTNKTMINNTNNITARALWADSGVTTVSTYAATAPTTGQVLTATSSTTATWQAIPTQATETLSATLTAGNTTGASDIVISSPQQILYNSGIRIGSDGVNAGTAGFAAIAVGSAANSSGYRGISVGQNAAATHTDAVAIGVSTATDDDKQIKLGANNTFYVETPGYLLSGLQKSCAAGITPGVSAAQSITSGSGITTILIKDTLYDWSTPMVSSNEVLLTDQAHVFLVSILVRGTFGAGLSGRTYTLYLYWNDGTNTKIIGQQDMYVAAAAGVFSCTVSTGMKTITGATGQYIYGGLDNTSGATMDITHYRISATRVA
jgi:hypothetical protein